MRGAVTKADGSAEPGTNCGIADAKPAVSRIDLAGDDASIRTASSAVHPLPCGPRPVIISAIEPVILR